MFKKIDETVTREKESESAGFSCPAHCLFLRARVVVEAEGAQTLPFSRARTYPVDMKDGTSTVDTRSCRLGSIDTS